jgi:hypothetical protein
VYAERDQDRFEGYLGARMAQENILCEFLSDEERDNHESFRRIAWDGWIEPEDGVYEFNRIDDMVDDDTLDLGILERMRAKIDSARTVVEVLGYMPYARAHGLEHKAVERICQLNREIALAQWERELAGALSWRDFDRILRAAKAEWGWLPNEVLDRARAEVKARVEKDRLFEAAARKLGWRIWTDKGDPMGVSVGSEDEIVIVHSQHWPDGLCRICKYRDTSEHEEVLWAGSAAMNLVWVQAEVGGSDA